MKVYVYESGKDDSLQLSLNSKVKDFYGYKGTLDLDIKPEKKWVQKEIEALSWSDSAVYATLPTFAKNVKVTYEIEE